ncbi:GFA family protein [Massilia suwonensis]|uniref:GFA family protein n=1 Tax=Massilia suwonensis TaxID=648895 RepID=A0ABW0MSP7_9BURK
MHQASSGNCTCGDIRYRITGPALQVVACHCGMCRRMTGAPFSSYVVVKEAELELAAQDEALASYPVTERTTRHFCRRCGTPVFNANPHTYRGLAMVYLGTLQGHEALAPGIAIYCENKLPWLSVSESARHFDAAPKRSS